MAHGWSVQWNSVVAMAVAIRSPESSGAVPGGGVSKCASGSLTPQNIRPMPMPALNIMATQDTVRNSGSSPSAPSVIRP